ncbi:MAG TPA: MFS transporter [Thermoanaerobaculia bacterium]|nr:MFS transporter [Thermoanaerobaculia bacterium]
MSAAARSSSSYSAVLRENPDFRRIWIGQVGSLLGDWFNQVAVLSLLLRLTGSGSAAGIFYVLQMVPVFLVSPLAGRVVDHLPRKLVMIAADVARAGVVLAFLLVDRPGRIWIVYAATFVQMAISSFFEPARNAVTPRVVRPEGLVAANALTATTWSVMLAAGAAIGGLLTALFGERTAFLLNSASYLWSAWFVFRAAIPPIESHPHPSQRGFIAGVREALRAPALLPVLCSKALLGLAGGTGLVLAIWGERVFRFGKTAAGGIGFLFAARGIGTGIGPFVARRWGSTQGPAARRTLAWGFLVCGAFLAAASVAHSALLAFLLLVGSGIGTAITWVLSTVLLQQETNDRVRGRVFAADQALVTLTISASMLATGKALDHPGWTPRGVGLGVSVVYLLGAGIYELLLIHARARSRSASGPAGPVSA